MISLLIFLLLFGLAVGSFLNVVAWRLPRGESLVSPGSHCTSCGRPIRAYDNIPVVSWFVLRGRCRDCGAAISWQYPAVEALTGALWVACGIAFDFEPELALGVFFVSVMVVVAVIDFEHKIIPNKIMILAAPIGFGLAIWADPDSVTELVIAGLAVGLPLALIGFIAPGGMGMGDAKLAGMMGLSLGRAVGPAMLIGFLVGSIVGVVIVARHGRAARRQAIPFGPFLALGGVVALFAGEDLVQLYLDTFTNG